MVVVLDTLTSVLAGFPVFMTMGYIAMQLNSSVTDVIDSGQYDVIVSSGHFCFALSEYTEKAF